MNISRLHIYRFIIGVTFTVLYALLFTSASLAAAPGVTDSSILLGQSCALSGPSEDLGKKMSAGIISAFDQSNVKGGVHGRLIRLIAKDDWYEPGQAKKNSESLIFEDKVFALIGEVGTPTSRVVVPIAEKEKVPFIAPFTGARFLRTPLKSQVINIRAGYDEETDKIVSYFVKERKFDRIACFYQDDSFGYAGLEGVKNALGRHGLEPVSTQSYQRNTVAIMGSFLRIRETQPQAVVLVGSYQPCAEFIKLAKAKGLDNAVFATLSFSGTRSLINALGNRTDNVIISQVVPSPFNTALTIVKNYQAAMAAFQPEQEISYISFEGYIAGRFFVKILEDLGRSVSRSAFISYIETRRMIRIDDMTLTFGPHDHQGLDVTYLTRIQDGKIVPLAE
jgi:branched-chain amino acid transport system substrate-binding protein